MSKTTPSETTPSEARAAANRANAQLSTGPRTPEGKARSSLNALKHGCFSRHLERAAERLGEDPAEFDALRTDLAAEYQPEGAEETILVDRMAALWWRMQRLAAQQQTYLAERLKAATPLFALQESEAPSLLEARLDRMLRAARKDLLARQGWRLSATERRVAGLRRTWEAEKAERVLAGETRAWRESQERLARARQQSENAAEEPALPEATGLERGPQRGPRESPAPNFPPQEGDRSAPGSGTDPRRRVGSSA